MMNLMKRGLNDMDNLLNPNRSGNGIPITRRCQNYIEIVKTKTNRALNLDSPKHVKWDAFWSLLPYEVLMAIVRARSITNHHEFTPLLISATYCAKNLAHKGSENIPSMDDDELYEATFRMWLRSLFELEIRHRNLTEYLYVTKNPFADRQDVLIIPLPEEQSGIPYDNDDPNVLVRRLQEVIMGDEYDAEEDENFRNPDEDDDYEEDYDEDDDDDDHRRYRTRRGRG